MTGVDARYEVDNIVLLSADHVQDKVKLQLREPYLNLDDFQGIFGSRTGMFRREELNNITPEWRDVTRRPIVNPGNNPLGGVQGYVLPDRSIMPGVSLKPATKEVLIHPL